MHCNKSLERPFRLRGKLIALKYSCQRGVPKSPIFAMAARVLSASVPRIIISIFKSVEARIAQ